MPDKTLITKTKNSIFKSEIQNAEPGILDTERTSYRQIFKSTSLFGGVQVFQILIGIIRTKFVAVLLGTTGVGLMGLFNAPLQLILSIAGLGITFSAVRDISEAYGNDDQLKVNQTVETLRRWSWWAGLLGTVVTVVLAPLLSKWTFGNKEYTWAFIWLSTTMLIQIISNGQTALIQSTRRLKDLAKTRVYGSLIGLFTALPLFYYFGNKGIVPSLILSAVTTLLMSWHYSNKINVPKKNMSFSETIESGKKMVKLGLVITVTGIIGFFTSYVLNAFISRTGGVDQVGLYNAGWNIIGQSTSLVFTAMATDFFPRLSSTNQDESKTSILVNQQAEMVMFILTPIIIMLILAMPILIRLLYTSEFLPVIIFANWTLVGILLKGFLWPVSFVFPAKGDLKAYGIIEISAMIFNIIINVLSYHYLGLEGLGISFIVGYIFGLTLTLLYARKRYCFKYDGRTIKSFLISFTLVSLVFFVSYFLIKVPRYLLGSVVLVVSISFSFFELDKRLGINLLVKEYYKRIFIK